MLPVWRENKTLALFYNEELSHMAVLHKSSGELWYANPSNPEDDSLAAGSMAGRLRSALWVNYYTSDDMSGTLNSYDACVETNNIKYDFRETCFGIFLTTIELNVYVSFCSSSA